MIGRGAAIALLVLTCGGVQQVSAPRPSSQPSEGAISITIICDNNPGQRGLTTAWGFAGVIRGAEKTILFDTGGDGRILMENMRRLELDPKEIDAVVLSHIHGDHTDGLPSFLGIRTGVPVYLPAGFPSAFKARVRSLGAQPEEAAQSEVICRGVRTTGTLGRDVIEEHGLCVKTREGWVLITGCAHPGVDDMAAQAKQVTGGPMHAVIGGFHLGSRPKAELNAIIDRLQELGVERIAPCHCSGDQARNLFKQRFGETCSLASVGSSFRFERAE